VRRLDNRGVTPAAGVFVDLVRQSRDGASGTVLKRALRAADDRGQPDLPGRSLRRERELSPDYTLLLALHVVSATMLVALLVLVAMNRREPLAPWLGGVFAALLLWTVAYVFELGSVSVSSKIAWANVQFIGATVMPLLWFLAMRRAVAAPRLPAWLTGPLWLTCAVIVWCAFANPGRLFRGSPALDVGGPVSFLHADYGPLYYALWVPFAYGLLMASLLTLAHAAVHGSHLVRLRCRLLIAATLLPMLVGVLFIAGVLPWPDYNPAVGSLSVSAALCAVALVRYRLLDVTPLARETVIEQLADPLVVTDARGALCDFNPAASSVLPELTREQLGRPLEVVLAERTTLLTALRAARGTAARGAPSAPAPTPGPDGRRRSPAREDDVALALTVSRPGAGACSEVRHYSLGVTPVVRDSGPQIGEAILLRDVTQRVRLYDEARRLASTDELTGLLSRRRLLELGHREVIHARRHGRTLGVLLLDVDRFKLVNDQYGHAAGDAVLRAVAERCRAELRASDLLGRYGGDELCAILPELEEAGARETAERLRAAVASLAVPHDGVTIRPTVSIGAVASPVDEETTPDELMRRADEALYEAKHAGRDRVAVGPCASSAGLAAGVLVTT
jgi:diguanylate cyclase (GGDEF)-like protein